MYKPKTSLELNIHHIERTMKKVHKGEIKIQDCGLNKRFDKLKEQSEAWFDELYPKYVDIVRERSFLHLQ